MSITRETARGRSLGGAYLLFIGLLTVAITAYAALHPNGWAPGDWLVNYAGGFVRRGLPGELILFTAHALHLSPVLLGSLLPLVFYALLYAVVWGLYRRSGAGLWTFAALVSPATLAFPILDPTGAFRKELLLLLALGFLLLWLARESPGNLALAVYLTLVGTICLLSHEGMLPFLLYLIGALWIGLDDPRRLLRILPVPIVATGVTLLAVLEHRGNLAEERTICGSLGSAPPVVCSGSIAYLANGTDVARAQVTHYIHAYHYLFYYPVLALLALLPLGATALFLWQNSHLRRDLRIVAVTAGFAVLASLPLFVVALDWGRWIYIHVFSVFLLLLFVDVRQGATRERAGVPAVVVPAPRGVAAGWLSGPAWVLVALVVYATCWNLPHYGNYPKKGYLNVPLHLLKEEMDRRHHVGASAAPGNISEVTRGESNLNG